VCHRTLLNVGFIDGVQPEELNRIQKLLNYKCNTSHRNLFRLEYEKESPDVRKWVDELYAGLLFEKKIDVPCIQVPLSKGSPPGCDWQTIDMNSLHHKDVRETGSEWLCYQAIEQLRISDFLSSQVDWEPDDVRLAITHIISRAVYPASELKTSRWITENSAVCELTGFRMDKITKDRLYNISRRLYTIKEKLENHLSKRTNEIFDIHDKIIIFDLSNTYFEGEKRGSKLARFGRSKEKRSDARLVVLALVINQFGFIKYSAILAGNVSDPSTLEAMIKDLRSKTSTTAEKALVVIDAGIATKENLKKIRAEGYDYLCVSRSRLKNYEIVATSEPLTVEDNRKRKIQLQKVSPANASTEEGDYFLKVESQAKKKKEMSMNETFRDRFLKGLEAIANSLTKKRGVKQESKVNQKVGRLMQKYPSINKYYQIDYQIEEKQASKKKPAQRIVTAMTWKLKENNNMDASCGIYFLRTSLNDKDRILWDSYNTIRDLEAVFRILKTDLDMRPIFHQKDENTMAHLHLAILAYWVVNTLRHQLKKEGINYQWNEIVRIMNTQKVVTTTVQHICDQIILIRRCSEQKEKVKMIYQALKFKQTPFKKKKVVVHKSELKNFEDSHSQPFSTM
jgi:hypothetical protein